MGRIIKTTSFALLLLVLGNPARAAENEPHVIKLSCDGMLTGIYGTSKPEASQPLHVGGPMTRSNVSKMIEAAGQRGLGTLIRTCCLTQAESLGDAYAVAGALPWTPELQSTARNTALAADRFARFGQD